MPSVRNLVTFQSSAFSTTEPKDYFINECCYGDDLARWLIQRLSEQGIETDKEPGQEDHGWYLRFRINGIGHELGIGHRPADGVEPAVWIGWVQRDAGFLGSLFGRHKRGILPESTEPIHAALAASIEVHGIRWHHQKDFDEGNEHLGSTTPAAS